MDTVDSRAVPPLFVNVIVAAGVLVVACCSARAGSPELCDQFHRECTEARAAGHQDVGIFHVERLECPADADGDTRGVKPSHQPRDDERTDRERSYGEHDGGP
jgi:hypothetical protein